MNNRKLEDEAMVNEIGKTSNTGRQLVHNSRVVIYDARPRLNAEVNRVKGGGYENIKNYRNSELLFCDIDNIHEVTKTSKKMQEISNHPEAFHSCEKYSGMLDNTDYMQFIATILKSINMVLDTMLHQNTNVLVHCSDGWDRTA